MTIFYTGFEGSSTCVRKGSSFGMKNWKSYHFDRIRPQKKSVSFVKTKFCPFSVRSGENVWIREKGMIYFGWEKQISGCGDVTLQIYLSGGYFWSTINLTMRNHFCLELWSEFFRPVLSKLQPLCLGEFYDCNVWEKKPNCFFDFSAKNIVMLFPNRIKLNLLRLFFQRNFANLVFFGLWTRNLWLLISKSKITWLQEHFR